MNLQLRLTSNAEAKLREHAAAAGQDVETFVLQTVTEKLADAQSQPKLRRRDHKEWAAKLQACIDLHPVVGHFVDDSRESIYAGRGE